MGFLPPSICTYSQCWPCAWLRDTSLDTTDSDPELAERSDWQTNKQTASATKTPSETRVFASCGCRAAAGSHLIKPRQFCSGGQKSKPETRNSNCVVVRLRCPNRSLPSPSQASTNDRLPGLTPPIFSAGRHSSPCALAPSSLPPDLAGDRGPPVPWIIQDCLPISTTGKVC